MEHRDDAAMTLEEAGRHLGISTRSALKLEVRALKKLARILIKRFKIRGPDDGGQPNLHNGD